MREIKFRAWDGKKLLPAYGLDTNGHIIHSREYDQFIHPGYATTLDTPRLQIMQYTGLKDCHGVEIFEGDVVRSIQEPDIWIGNVYFEFGKFLIKDIRGRTGGQYISINTALYDIVGDEGGAYEVIGNVYEAPDLLNDTKLTSEHEGSTGASS